MTAEDKMGTGKVKTPVCVICGNRAVWVQNGKGICRECVNQAQTQGAVEAERARIVAALDELRKPAIFGAEEARRKNRYDLKREFNLIAEAYDKAIAIARGEEEGG